MLTWLFDFSCWKKRVQIKLLFQVQLDKTVVVASNSHGQPVGDVVLWAAPSITSRGQWFD